jgi:hypothetical protein
MTVIPNIIALDMGIVERSCHKNMINKLIN